MTYVPSVLASFDKKITELEEEISKAEQLVAKMKPKDDEKKKWRTSLERLNISVIEFPTTARHISEIADMKFKGVQLINGWLWTGTSQGSAKEVSFWIEYKKINMKYMFIAMCNTVCCYVFI